VQALLGGLIFCAILFVASFFVKHPARWLMRFVGGFSIAIVTLILFATTTP